MILIIIGIVLIAICFCSLILMMLFPKLGERPIMSDMVLYSLVLGMILTAIGAFITN